MDFTWVRAAGSAAAVAAVCSSAVLNHADSRAAALTLAWDPGASGTAGYTVYSGEAARTYSSRNVCVHHSVRLLGHFEGHGTGRHRQQDFRDAPQDHCGLYDDKADQERQGAEAAVKAGSQRSSSPARPVWQDVSVSRQLWKEARRLHNQEW